MDVFFGQHPKLKTFLKKQEKFLRKNGYLVSLFGRKEDYPKYIQMIEEKKLML